MYCQPVKALTGSLFGPNRMPQQRCLPVPSARRLSPLLRATLTPWPRKWAEGRGPACNQWHCKEVEMAAEERIRLVEDEGVEYELLPHALTESAAAEAEAVGVDAADVAKTLVVTTPEGYVRAVLPASDRLDLRKLREITGGARKKVHLATEEDLARDYPEFELGAVPPLAGARRDRVLIDSRVAERESVVIEAGSHDESIRLPTDALLRLTGAQMADLREE